MAEIHSANIVEKVKSFTQKLDENHHEIELSFNKELKRSLSKSELKEQSAEECDELIETLNEALEIVEGKASYTLTAVKDNLKQAKIDALERKLECCTCLPKVTMRHDRPARNSLRSGSEISNTSRDSRVRSDPGEGPVVQPSDASKDDSNKEEIPKDEDKA